MAQVTQAAPVNGDTHVQSAVLEDLSDAVNYRRWLADLARPYLGGWPLEVGSGLGHYVREWLPDVEHFTATEADEHRLGELRQRFAGEPRVEVRALSLPAEEIGEHTAVVALNVLEHVEDHVGALRSVARMVHPGGAIVLLVPAFPFAMSQFDRTIGHVRRYTVPSMRAALGEAELRIERLHYLNPVGLLGWYVMCTLLRQFPANGPVLQWYDRFVVPSLRRAEQGWRPPFGQSVFAVARTPDRRG